MTAFKGLIGDSHIVLFELSIYMAKIAHYIVRLSIKL